MKKTVYIETIIPSSYYDIRTDSEAVARRRWTRTFGDFESTDYEIVTGVGVIDEL